MSESLSHTPWAATIVGPQKPICCRYSVGDAWNRSADVFTSSSVSARWISSGLPYFSASARQASRTSLSTRNMECGRHRRRDERVVVEFLEETLSARQRVGGRLCVWGREPDDGLAQDAAETRGLRGARDLLFEIVHVGIRGRARADHLECSDSVPARTNAGADGLRLGREDVLLQPVRQREIVSKATVHDHGRVPVGVDQTGHDDAACCIDDAPRRVVAAEYIGGADRHDIGALNRHGAGRQHPPGGVDGDDGAAGYQEIDRLGPLRLAGRGGG